MEVEGHVVIYGVKLLVSFAYHETNWNTKWSWILFVCPLICELYALLWKPIN